MAEYYNHWQWVVDVSTFLSIFGFLITIFLLIEARKIRKSFRRKARLPETIKSLQQSFDKLDAHLKQKEFNSKSMVFELFIIKSLLENLVEKLPELQKKDVLNFIKGLQKGKFIFKHTITEIDEKKSWELWAKLSAIIVSLKELKKDEQWD